MTAIEIDFGELLGSSATLTEVVCALLHAKSFLLLTDTFWACVVALPTLKMPNWFAPVRRLGPKEKPNYFAP